MSALAAVRAGNLTPSSTVTTPAATSAIGVESKAARTPRQARVSTAVPSSALDPMLGTTSDPLSVPISDPVILAPPRQSPEQLPRQSPEQLPRQSLKPSIDFSHIERAFRAFLPNVTIFSKDLGRTNINLFDAQDYFLTELFSGLQQDIHWFVCGKGRQLGITTICLLLDCFWCGSIPDVQGAVVFDTLQNKDKFRLLLTDMLEHLPPALALPTKKFDRDFIAFKNGNMLDFLTAGTRKGQGTLGRSRALNFVHATECCSWGDPDAVEAFKDTLSDQFPARLYLFESTARGPQLFMDLWEEAGDDPVTKKQIFLGWWRKDTNRYPVDSRLFARYGYEDKSKWELEAEANVKRLYGYDITLGQWAWFRHRSDPRSASDWNAEDNSSRMEVVHEEHPTTPDDMFRQTGSTFIPGVMLKKASENASKHPYKAFRYYIGEDIQAVHLEPMPAALRSVTQLRIWEDPVPGGRYVMAADPAYASGDESDFYCISLFHVYADRCIQVAEFAERNMFDYQFAWIMAHLANYYGKCRIILDINGPGQAVLGEFRHLRQMMESGMFDVNKPYTEMTDEDFQQNRSLRNFFGGVRDYLYHRFDSFSSGFNLQWKSTVELQASMWAQFRDQLLMGQCEIYSQECLGQVRRLVQDGMFVTVDGNTKKDRAIAAAMAVRCWIDMERRELIAEGRTYDAENAATLVDEMNTVGQYVGQLVRGRMDEKQKFRRNQERLIARPNWRTGVWDRGRPQR